MAETGKGEKVKYWLICYSLNSDGSSLRLYNLVIQGSVARWLAGELQRRQDEAQNRGYYTSLFCFVSALELTEEEAKATGLLGL